MTTPHEFTPVAAQDEKRDPNEFIPWMRCAEMVTPRGLRPGKVLVVRPLQQIDDFRPIQADRDPNAWRGKLTIADVACLDAIDAAQDEYGMPLPGFPAGHQFRDQVVFPGFLNKAFRNYVGKTLIGLVYLGPNTKGKPPLLWRDLGADPQAIARGQQFLAAFPDFLIPTAHQITQATDATPAPAQNPGYGADPWVAQSQPTSSPPQQNPANTLQQLQQWRAQEGRQSDGPPPF